MLKPDLNFHFLDQIDIQQFDLVLDSIRGLSTPVFIGCPMPINTSLLFENIVDLHMNNQIEGQALFQELKEKHFQWALQYGDGDKSILDEINDLCVEAEWLLEEPAQDSPTYVYDQIIGLGPILGSLLLSVFLRSKDVLATWMDPRDLIITDDQYKSATILEEETLHRFYKLTTQHQMICFGIGVGSTVDNNTTTFDLRLLKKLLGQSS